MYRKSCSPGNTPTAYLFIVFIVYRLAIKQVQLIGYNIQGTKATGMNLNTTITVETPGNGVPTSNVTTEFLCLPR